MNRSTPLPIAALLAALLPALPSLHAQANSTNIAGSGNAIQAGASNSAILAGANHRVAGTNSGVVAGASATITAGVNGGFIAGANAARISTNANFSAVVGGVLNTVTNSAARSVIAGGFSNVVASVHSAVIGGVSNRTTAQANRSVVLGGSFNTNNSPSAVILGGDFNFIGVNSTGAAVVGGVDNIIESNSRSATIGGGENNTVDAIFGTVGGGENNSASGGAAAVLGGRFNSAVGVSSVVGGGYANGAWGSFATIPGGYDNFATNFSFAAGQSANAEHSGSFVWGCKPTIWADITRSFTTNSFTARAPGGVRFYTAASGITNGAWLKSGLSSWATLSDSNAKTKVSSVSARRVLAKLAELPVTEWEYKSAPSRRFYGPMAQDFHAAFGLGEDDKTINTLDADGVLFLSVQGLVEEIKLRDEKIAQLEAWSREEGARSRTEIQELKSKLRAVEERLSLLPPAP